MKLFDKMELEHYELGSGVIRVETLYFFLNRCFWITRKIKTASDSDPQWTSLRQDSDGYLERDKQCEYLDIQ